MPTNSYVQLPICLSMPITDNELHHQGSWLAAAPASSPHQAPQQYCWKVHNSHVSSFCPWNKGGQEEGFRMRLLWCFSAGAETVFMRSLQISTVSVDVDRSYLIRWWLRICISRYCVGHQKIPKDPFLTFSHYHDEPDKNMPEKCLEGPQGRLVACLSFSILLTKF